MNEIEIHPWKFFPQSGKGKKLIIGSYPPKRFTNPQNLQDGDVDFFYGSIDNRFWDLFCEAKNLEVNWRINPELLKQYLMDNNWIVSDIVFKTKRNRNTALDKDLKVLEWMIEILIKLINQNEIEVIYFTSKWVQQKFCQHIAPFLKSKPLTVILISPSRAGLMSMNWARDILPQTIDETNAQYRLRYYNHFLNI